MLNKPLVREAVAVQFLS